MKTKSSSMSISRYYPTLLKIKKQNRRKGNRSTHYLHGKDKMSKKNNHVTCEILVHLIQMVKTLMRTENK